MTNNSLQSTLNFNPPLSDALDSDVIDTEILQSHLEALRDRMRESERDGDASGIHDAKLQLARTLIELGHEEEAWAFGRESFDFFFQQDDWENAADACEILYRCGHAGSLSALGQGIWLAVTCPIDPELSIELLNHIIEDTPHGADGAAVAATTALFIADMRCQGQQRDNLMFFSSQMLGQVARRHSQVDSQHDFDAWMDRLELREPDKFLPRLRNVIDVLVQDDWWFDRDSLQNRLFTESP